jgi:preprotein translocase subunit SecA|tara:strand:- start:952 stop:2100 length:1149 start_codon:yes stop_codon:yes gene_type:complete
MAGRGTDILLGGNATFLTADVIKDIFDKKNVFENNPFIASLTQNEKALMENLKGNNYQKLLKQPLSELENKTDPEIVLFLKLYNSILKEQEQLVKQARDAIINLGGLHVIGTERHESRRIDNQLRGRSGRQGDPGSSRFFLCLEDKLLRIFGGDQILNVMQNIGFQDDTPIQSGLLNKSLESAQKKVESFYFDTRKQLFEYDQALNIQRNSVYSERRRIFEKTSVRDWLVDYAARSLDDLLNRFKIVDDYTTINFITLKLQNLLGGPFPVNFNETDQPQYLSFLQQQIEITYDLKEVEMELIEVGLFRELEKSFILQQIDNAWTEHLQKIAFLRDSIRWIAYGQKDPLTEYKKEAFNYFNIMLARIRHRVVYFVLRAKTILI